MQLLPSRRSTSIVALITSRLRRMSNRNLHALAALLVLALGASVDCAQASNTSSNPYLLAPGDVISVRVAGETDLSGNFTINNAGEVILPLLGPVGVADKTTEACQEVLKIALSKSLLKQPVVSVSVETFRPISVMGEVRVPGIYPFAPGRTVKAAVAQAGGYGVPGQTMGTERLGVLALNHDRLLIRQARLQAQLAGQSDFKAPTQTLTMPETVGELTKAEQVNIKASTRTLASQISVLEEQRPKLAAEEQAMEGQVASETRQTELLRKRLKDYEELDQKGLSRSRDLIELRLTLATKEGNIWALRAQRSRAAISQMELNNKIQELRLQHEARTLGELDEVRRQLLEISATLPGNARSGLGSEATSEGKVTIIRYRGTTRQVIETDEFALLEPGDHVDARLAPPARPQNQSQLGAQ
jgi:polysaccharide export outer membrane protein